VAGTSAGAQNSASKGQTSTQMPQYMHSDQSMANRSSTLRTRGRPPGRTGAAASVCPST
jgi:hypothetical protein